jgi:cytochrome oxidase Cu insertion factor (SCO1/SenC/PrrC family)
MLIGTPVIRILPLFALLLAGCGVSSPTPSTDIDPGWQVGHFSLTERSGKTITDKDLRGSVWVASCIFTRCNGPCPTVSSTMVKLQKEFKDEPGVKLVTFTVDPARDDLAALREYANLRGADPDRWLFLTGEEKTVHKLLVEQFKLGVQKNLDPDVKPGQEFDHSPRLTVVDKTGVIRGTFPGMPDTKRHDADTAFAADLDRLKVRVRELLK